MSNTTEFEKLKNVIEAIKADEVMMPNMPIEVFLIEAEALYNTALVDKEKLIARKLKIQTINMLPIAVPMMLAFHISINNAPEP